MIRWTVAGFSFVASVRIYKTGTANAFRMLKR
jgi:hypothetical protein